MDKRFGKKDQEVINKIKETKSKTSYSTCSLCDEKVLGGREGLIKHGEEYHSEHFLAETRREFQPKKYWNPMTEKWHGGLVSLVREIKKISSKKEYWDKYGKEYLKDLWENNIDKKYGEYKNIPICLECGGETPFSDYERGFVYPVFCSLSCSTLWHSKHTDRIEKSKKTITEKEKIDSTFNLKPNQKSYWINKGFTEDEAKQKVKERQSTNTLDKFIERYGEDEGTKRFLERQEKWIQSLKEGNSLYIGYSKVSQELFTEIQKEVPTIMFGKNEKQFKISSGVIKVDCYEPLKNKVIEFFGDYWHANPTKYNSFDNIKVKSMLAEDIWKQDRIRISELKKKVDILVIWENDYVINKQKIILDCIHFLTN
jgi:hypothetical protein